MRIGMTRKQLETLWKRSMPLPLSNADYPKTAAQAASELVFRGYKVGTRTWDANDMMKATIENPEDKMKSLVRRGIIELEEVGTKAKWTKKAVDAASNYFESRGDFSPYASLCFQWDFPYADFVAGLLDARDNAIDEFGSVAVGVIPSPSEIYFTMHMETTSPFGHGRSPGRVWFTLRDDVRKELETKSKTK